MEFMLCIFNEGDAKAGMTEAIHRVFVSQCETYIDQLKAGGNLIAAQPLLQEGLRLSRNDSGNWQTAALANTGKVQVGYYHIIAPDLAAALAIAKNNPEFAFVPSASIEIKTVKTREDQTGFVYPAGPL